MQSYKRKITYFYQYQNGTVGSTAGFMKLEIRGDKVKINVNIQEPVGLPYKEAGLYFYHEAGDHLAAIKVDTIESVDGVLTYQTRTDWQKVFHTERDLYTFDGVAVVYNDAHYYIGDFADKDRRNYELVKKEPKPIIAKMVPILEEDLEIQEKRVIEKTKEKTIERSGLVEQEELTKSMENKQETEPATEQMIQNVPVQNVSAQNEPIQNMPAQNMPIQEQITQKSIAKDSILMNEKETGVPATELKKEESAEKDSTFGMCQNCPYQEKRMEQRKEQLDDADAFEKMVQNYPKLPMYGATELFDCVRIHPRDIGKLDMRNWKLGVNSFLTHGFYTYQYLLLGKMRFEDGNYRCILGVPGVFSNREKYLANMFGFDQFIPVKKTGIKTGEFGYWIVEIIPSL